MGHTVIARIRKTNVVYAVEEADGRGRVVAVPAEPAVRIVEGVTPVDDEARLNLGAVV